jgi:hypothetical protein
VTLNGKVTSMGFETSKGLIHVWATVEDANGSRLYEKRGEETLEAYTRLLTLIVDRMVSLTEGSKWLEVDNSESTSTTE